MTVPVVAVVVAVVPVVELVVVGVVVRPRDGAPSVAKAAKPLKILILGGTGFLGPCVVRRAVARGHTMTLFNRGKTDPTAFPELEKLHESKKYQAAYSGAHDAGNSPLVARLTPP